MTMKHCTLASCVAIVNKARLCRHSSRATLIWRSTIASQSRRARLDNIALKGWAPRLARTTGREPLMRMFAIVMLTAWVGVLLAGPATETINFDKDAPGKPPAGWTATRTGRGEAKWSVE